MSEKSAPAGMETGARVSLQDCHVHLSLLKVQSYMLAVSGIMGQFKEGWVFGMKSSMPAGHAPTMICLKRHNVIVYVRRAEDKSLCLLDITLS